jgi:hypothetical protein
MANPPFLLREIRQKTNINSGSLHWRCLIAAPALKKDRRGNMTGREKKASIFSFMILVFDILIFPNFLV